jgi:hypothetical protein
MSRAWNCRSRNSTGFAGSIRKSPNALRVISRAILAKRLILANAKIDLLSAY